MRKTMTGITNPTEEYFKDGTWGWDGTQWRKQGILFGYRATVNESISNTNANAGINALNSATVPAGELWIIQLIGAMNVNTACSRIAFFVYRTPTEYPVLDQVTCTANVWVTWAGNVVLKTGDYLKAYFLGCTAGDDIYLRYLGYKVSVT